MLHAAFCLSLGLAMPTALAIAGAVYALFFDPKATLPRGHLKRLL